LKTYLSKLENLDEMDKLLHRYKQSKLNQVNINHLNRPIISTEIEAIIRTSLKRRAQGLMDS
jgi:hypothetical protein